MPIPFLDRPRLGVLKRDFDLLAGMLNHIALRLRAPVHRAVLEGHEEALADYRALEQVVIEGEGLQRRLLLRQGEIKGSGVFILALVTTAIC